MEQDFVIAGVSALVLTVSLTQIVKNWVENRWTPIVSIIIGVLLSVAGSWGYFTPETVVRGVVIGLISSGLWDVGKKTVLNK